MPDPPPTSLFTTYVLENPWPLGGLLFVVAAVLVWRGLGEGRTRVAAAGGIAALLAVTVFIVATIVQTSAERARPIVRSMVEAAEQGDIAGVMSLFSDDASLHFGRPENPGVAIDSLRRAVSSLGDMHRIDDNTITRLRAYTIDADRAVVHLTCRTTTASSRGPVASRWVLRVMRDSDGAWRVDRITCVSVAGQAPSPSLFRL